MRVFTALTACTILAGYSFGAVVSTHFSCSLTDSNTDAPVYLEHRSGTAPCLLTSYNSFIEAAGEWSILVGEYGVSGSMSLTTSAFNGTSPDETSYYPAYASAVAMATTTVATGGLERAGILRYSVSAATVNSLLQGWGSIALIGPVTAFCTDDFPPYCTDRTGTWQYSLSIGDEIPIILGTEIEVGISGMSAAGNPMYGGEGGASMSFNFKFFEQDGITPVALVPEPYYTLPAGIFLLIAALRFRRTRADCRAPSVDIESRQ